MRCTQWIGLTERAQKFVADLEQYESDSFIRGMGGELLPLGKWKAPESLGAKAVFVREKVQVEPWSSGPMIFTKLVIEYYQAEDLFTEECFQWINDPTVEGEFDQKNGRFWV